MCGIAGIHEPGASPALEVLGAMASDLRHRGPDATGLYLDDDVGMVSSRLAVVDLTTGDQPLGTERGDVWAVQNGEIYNHVALRRELTDLGHVFRTRSDTEVIAHAYEEWGPACLPRLNGDFAFAVWDRRRSELFLARDRFGVRPLFVALRGSQLAFASEAKALLRLPHVQRELDPASLVDSFTTWALAPDRSAFSGVAQLPPAHWLLAGRWGHRQMRWWDLDFTDAEAGKTGRPAARIAELSDLLDDATRLRTQADVPVAAFLSGGLDSSLIAAFARRHTAGRLRCFGVGFRDQRYDETVHQRAVARELAVDLHHLTITDDDLAALLPRAVELAEQPTLRTAPVPLLALSEEVRESGLKVVLTGEGADELFGGYRIFQEAKLRRLGHARPRSEVVSRLLRELYSDLPGGGIGRAAAFADGFFRRESSDVEDALFSHAVRFANSGRLTTLLSPAVRMRAAEQGDPLERLRARLPDGFASFSPLGRAQYLEVTTFLSGYLLHAQGDRMLMGNSVEGRYPFLDHRVAAAAARLPDRQRLRGMTEKYALREVARPLLPAAVRRRSKQAYRAPIARAILGLPASDYADALLSPATLRRAGLFDVDRVSLLVDKVRRRLARHAAGVSETDEMAIAGVVSTMLLHEGLVVSTRPAGRAMPSRLVVGDGVAHLAEV